MAAKRKKHAKKRKHHRKAKKGGHIPVATLNKRLVRLNSILVHRAGGKSYSGKPT